MGSPNHNLTPWEWISLIGVMLGSGVSVTVFAMSHFESKEDSDKRESRLERRISRIETMQEALLRKQNIELPPRLED